MKLFSPMEIVRKTAVFMLALWLAGAGCLLGCEGMAAAAPEAHHDSSSSSDKTSTLVVEGDACASTETHSCCKKKSRASKKQPTAPVAPVNKRLQDLSSARLNESATGGMKACPFAISRALSVAKLRDADAGVTNAISYAVANRPVGEQTRALSVISPLPNRGHTYLRCCSFLI